MLLTILLVIVVVVLLCSFFYRPFGTGYYSYGPSLLLLILGVIVLLFLLGVL